MAFTPSLSGSRTYIKYADCEVDEVLVTGFYVGEETSKFKNQLYVFRQAEGNEVICLNATGKLTKWIENEIDTGDLVRIVYKGKKPIMSGPMAGKEAHDFYFEVDLDHRERFKKANEVPATAVKAAPVTNKVITDAMDEGIL